MAKIRKFRLKLVGGIFLFGLLLLVPTVLDYGKSYPIEGLWRSHLWTNCLCDSYNFWQFKDEKITGYSDTHLTEGRVGEYEKLGEGLYRITLYSDTAGVPPREWTVSVEKKTFYPPADPTDHVLRRWVKRFRRIPMTDLERNLIETAPARDMRIQKEIDEWEAREAAMQSTPTGTASRAE